MLAVVTIQKYTKVHVLSFISKSRLVIIYENIAELIEELCKAVGHGTGITVIAVFCFFKFTVLRMCFNWHSTIE